MIGALQKAAENGQLKKVIFGRNEAGLHHFHQHDREALGQPLLEPVHAPAGARP